jgi:hypothetical protein
MAGVYICLGYIYGIKYNLAQKKSQSSSGRARPEKKQKLAQKRAVSRHAEFENHNLAQNSDARN